MRILTPLLLLVFVNGFSQSLNYEVHGKYEHPIKIEVVNKARYMGDIIPYYPVDWIMGYISTEILTTYAGHSFIAIGKNDTLSEEQKKELRNVDLGTDISITIMYYSKNSVTGNPDIRTMHYSATTIPETEAEYHGGKEQLAAYLKANAIDKIPDSSSKQFQDIVIRFTVNEEGEVTNALLSGTSGDPETDTLLLETIHNMPGWKPAENAKGKKVKQEFEFRVGMSGC